MIIKSLFFFIAFISTSFHFTSAQAFEQAGYTVIEDKAQLPIKTPSFSERKVLKIKLNNGLQAVLISDPKTDQSAAVITVEAGSWQDPVEYPGIAHFLEHMLFLGTKQYPKESEYQNFITEHGGSSNAFTTNDYTSYMFSVDNNAFPQALNMFSSFFKDPLFNPSGVSRELNAIDQEYAKNYENDDIRELMVLKDIENPEHPNHRFNMGNTGTLHAVSQETLRNWYEGHYSANLMKLLVISNQPLEQMVHWVVDDFSAIVNRDKVPYVPEMDLSNPALEGKFVYIEPIKNVRTLSLVWDLPQEFWDMKDTRPDHLICQILGHEGQESLLAQLKREKLAETIACSTYDLGGKNLVFYVQFDLTDEGIQQIDHIILRFFQTVAMLKAQPFPRYIYEEMKQINTIDYEYQERDDAFQTVMRNAQMLTGEDLSTYPEQTKIIQKFNPEDVQKLLNDLTPQNARFLIKAPSELTGVKSTQEEPWLHVAYAIKPIDLAMMTEWSQAKPIPEITLPLANPFLPKSLELVNPSADHGAKLPLVPHPKQLMNSDLGNVYYAADQRYLIPQLYLYFNIKTPAIDKGKAEKVVVADTFVEGLQDALSKFSYPALMAGMNFNVERTDFGISLKITGYSDHASLLFDEIVKLLRGVTIPEQKFKIFKQSLLRDYQNFNQETPLKRVKEMFKNAIYKSYATESQKAVAMRKLTYSKFNEEVQNLFNQSYVEGIVYGNVTETQAQEYANKLITALHSEPYAKGAHQRSEVITLPEEKGPFFFEIKIPAQGSAAMLAIEEPSYTFKKRAAQQVLMTAMNEPFFSDLRTKQQTGYLVFSLGEEVEQKLFNAFLVQSNTHEPRDLLARFELFIEGFLQNLERTYLTRENFETIRVSLLHDLEKPQNNMEDMGNLLQTLAFKYEGQFDWMDKRIQGLKELTYEEMVDFAHQMMGKENKRRLGLLVKGLMDQNKVLNYLRVGTLAELKKISTFSYAFEKQSEDKNGL